MAPAIDGKKTDAALPRRARAVRRSFRDPAARRGSVVLVALCLVTVLAVAVIGYFAVCLRTMELSNRSYCYTASEQLAEIGMEEALWSLDQALNTSGYAWSGWTLTTVGSVPTATKQLTGFTVNKGLSGTVNIKVEYYDTSTPFTRPPIITADGVTSLQDGSQVDKQLKAIVKPASLFRNALASTAGPDAPAPSYYSNSYVMFSNDNNVTIDSYDSQVNGGGYTPSPSTTNRSDQAIICAPYLKLANANILGYVAAANPSAPDPQFTSGTLKGFGTASGTSVDNSRISNNGVQPDFDIVTPPQVTLLPTSGSGSIGPGSYYYTSTNYEVPNGSTLTIKGPATLYIQNELIVYGTITVRSDSTGPVQIYVGRGLYVYPWFGAGSGFDNQTKNPAYLGLFGPSPYYGSYLGQSSPFYGVIYMPRSDVYLYYGFPTWSQTIYGSIVGYHVISQNHFNSIQVHYDLNLRKTTFSMVNTPYVVSEWIDD